MKKIRKHQIEKEEKYKKELRRFDPILKEIFSKAAGKLISIATGEKINKELEDITTEIEFVKSLRPDMVFRAGEKIFHIEIQVQQDRLSCLWEKGILRLPFSRMNSQFTNSLF